MKHIAKRLLSLLLVVCLVLSVAVIPAGAAETKLTSVYASYAAEGHTNAPVADDVFEAKSDSITVSILTTTDMHGRAYDWNSYTNSALSNNFLQAAKLVAERRAAVDDSILIDVGDILQGSALSSYNILQEGGENSPMATARRYIGYDAFVLGNHEFNYAPQIQWNYYNLLTSTDKAVAGQPVDVICSNVVETETNESVFSPYKTFTYKFEDGTTFTIGLLGFENMNNANWDVASHYEGCTFGHPDNTEKSYVYEWENYYGKEMQEKCDYIIVAMHSGEGNPDIYNQENQGGYFATHTTGVDMLLTGHNHQRNAVTLQNKNGENVLVMNGGGSTLGETVLTLTKGADGKVTVTAAESTMHPLNSALGKDENGMDIRVPSPDFKSGDPNYDGLKDLITPLFERSDAFVNKKIGTVSGTWDTISNYYLTQSDSYDLVHKAQIWADGITSTAYDTDRNNVIVVDGNERKLHQVDMESGKVLADYDAVAGGNFNVPLFDLEYSELFTKGDVPACYSIYNFMLNKPAELGSIRTDGFMLFMDFLLYGNGADKFTAMTRPTPCFPTRILRAMRQYSYSCSRGTMSSCAAIWNTESADV